MTQLHGIGISAVFAADAELDIGPRASALFDGNLHELANAGLIDRREWIPFHDIQFGICRQEGTRVVTAHSEAHLRQVICTETEELGSLGNLVGRQCAARDFNHRAHQVIELHLLLGHHFLRHAMDHLNLKIQFSFESDQRDHDFRPCLDSGRLDFCRGLEHRARLHF